MKQKDFVWMLKGFFFWLCTRYNEVTNCINKPKRKERSDDFLLLNKITFNLSIFNQVIAESAEKKTRRVFDECEKDFLFVRFTNDKFWKHRMSRSSITFERIHSKMQIIMLVNTPNKRKVSLFFLFTWRHWLNFSNVLRLRI